MRESIQHCAAGRTFPLGRRLREPPAARTTKDRSAHAGGDKTRGATGFSEEAAGRPREASPARARACPACQRGQAANQASNKSTAAYSGQRRRETGGRAGAAHSRQRGEEPAGLGFVARCARKRKSHPFGQAVHSAEFRLRDWRPGGSARRPRFASQGPTPSAVSSDSAGVDRLGAGRRSAGARGASSLNPTQRTAPTSRGGRRAQDAPRARLQGAFGRSKALSL
jgi:hypothetical protein